MFRNSIIIVACLGVAACVGQRIEEGTNKLIGKPIDAAIAKLGVPTEERTIADRKVYIWFTSNISEGTQLKCQLRAIMNGNLVGSFDFDGNNVACAKYARMLRE